jgi:hypothetical protein
MRQLKNNLDELYDLLVSTQMRETLKKYQLEVEATLFEQQVKEITKPDFVHENLAALLKNDILEQSAQRRKSSKFLEESTQKKARSIPIEYARAPRPKPDKVEKAVSYKKSKIEIGPELAMTLCLVAAEGFGLSSDSLPLKRSLSMREEESEDVPESFDANELEEPRILVRGRTVRGLKALAVERYLPGTFRNEAYDTVEVSFSEDEELDDRYCKALGSAFKVFVRERRVPSH